MNQKMIDQFQKPLQGEEIAARNIFRFNDRHSSISGTVLVLHILQERLLLLGSMRSLVLKHNIHSLVPLPK